MDFHHIAPSVFSQLHSISQRLCYKKGSIIFYEGEALDDIFILVSGRIKNVRFYDTFEEVLEYFDEVTILGETTHITNNTPPLFYPYSAIADSDCDIIKCPKKDLLKLMASSYEVLFFIIHLMARKIQLLQDKAYGYPGSFKQKIARYIDQMHKCGDKINIKEIASFFNYKYETVLRAIKRLESLGIIARDKHKLIKIDRLALRKIYSI